MKKLDEIKEMVKDAQQRWGEINDELNPLYPLSRVGLCEKKEKLKNLLENIRENIEALLSYSCTKVDVCKSCLESILGISEDLRISYAFPGYVESFYIMDTIKIADGLMNRKN
jgi:hypothetical protein